MTAPDRACPDYPNECVHPWAHARTYAEVKATQDPPVNASARAVGGQIVIPGCTLTPDDAEQFAWDIQKIVADVRHDVAATACAAQGHQLWRANGYLADAERITLTVCRRNHCGHHSVDPGHTDSPDPESDLEGRLLLLLHALNIAKLAPWPAAPIGASK